MCKIAEAYNALDNDARKWYVATAQRALSNWKRKFGKDAMKLGPRYKGNAVRKAQKKQANGNEVDGDSGRRDFVSSFPANPAKELPTGWTTRVSTRQDQTNRTLKNDKCWYSPVQLYRFRSMVKVNQFLERLKEVNGDEVMAYKLCQFNDSKKRKCKDAADIVVYDRKNVKKRNIFSAEAPVPTAARLEITTTESPKMTNKSLSDKETYRKTSVCQKRPGNAFCLYASEVRNQVRLAHPNLKGSKVVRIGCICAL